MARYKVTNNSAYPKTVSGVEIGSGETETVEMLVKEAESITDHYLDFERVEDMLEDEASASERQEESEETENPESNSHDGGEQ